MTQLTFKIEANGLVFTGGSYNEQGFYYSDLEDWFGVSQANFQIEQIPNSDYAFHAEKATLESKTISLTGLYSGPTPNSASRAKVHLTSTLRNRGESITLAVWDGEEMTWRQVWLYALKIPHSSHDSFEFVADFVSPDPYRYGSEVTITTGLPTPNIGGFLFPVVYPIKYGQPGEGGRLAIVNRGEETAGVDFTVQGGSMAGGFDIKDTDSQFTITYRGSLAESDVVHLSAADETVLVNGIDRSQYLDVTDWPFILAGRTGRMQFTARGSVTGKPRLTAQLKPAYL